MTGARFSYMVRRLRSCSIPYMNPDDLETAAPHPNHLSFRDNFTIGSILI
jgi:hypothetical protein